MTLAATTHRWLDGRLGPGTARWNPAIGGSRVHFVSVGRRGPSSYAEICGGAAEDRSAALTQGVFEHMERYAAARGSGRRLDAGGAFDAYELRPYADEQYAEPGFPHAPSSRVPDVAFVRATDLHTGRPWAVPAVAMLHPYGEPDGGRLVHATTSTGLAAARSAEEAIVAGLFEVIERDAVLGAVLRRVARDLAGPSCYGIDAPRDRGVRWALLDVTSDLEVPTTLAWRQATVFGVTVATFGSASRVSRRGAAMKAMAEAEAHACRLTHLVLDARASLPTAAAVDSVLAGAYGPVSAWSGDRAEAYFAGWTYTSASPRPLDLAGDATSGPWSVAKKIAGQVRVFVADLTTRDLATLGVHVVRVFVPDCLSPLILGFPPCLGARRLPPDVRMQLLRDGAPAVPPL